MTNLSLRSMALDDIDVIEQIERAVHVSPWPREDLERALIKPYRSWVVMRDVIIVGYIILQWLPHEATVMNIATHARYQRQGVASKLLQQALDQGQQAGHECMHLEVRRANKMAIQLYKKFGFQEIARRQGYYPPRASSQNGQSSAEREDAIVMRLNYYD